MRVVVTGGRDYENRLVVVESLTPLRDKIDVLIHGGARGADTLCAQVADELGITTVEYPADWKAHGRGAGPRRNQQMIDEGQPDLCLAYPGGRGTADMVRRCKKADIPVVNVEVIYGV